MFLHISLIYQLLPWWIYKAHDEMRLWHLMSVALCSLILQVCVVIVFPTVETEWAYARRTPHVNGQSNAHVLLPWQQKANCCESNEKREVASFHTVCQFMRMSRAHPTSLSLCTFCQCHSYSSHSSFCFMLFFLYNRLFFFGWGGNERFRFFCLFVCLREDRLFSHLTHTSQQKQWLRG